MRRFGILFLCLIAASFYLPGPGANAGRAAPALQDSTATTTTPPSPALSAKIDSPLPGQALQGGVPIYGSTPIEGFQSLELAFAYFDDPTDTWFLILESDQPVSEGLITQWDTSTISDGVYTLRMTVTLVDGRQETHFVPSVRVRNYSPIETVTPTPPEPTATAAPQDTSVPTNTVPPTETPIPAKPTPLPTNPAEISRTDVFASLGQGAIAVLGLFALVMILQTLRAKIKGDREK